MQHFFVFNEEINSAMDTSISANLNINYSFYDTISIHKITIDFEPL